MSLKTVCCFFLLIAGWMPLKAAPRPYDFNARCRQAYGEIMMMRLSSGEKLLEEEKRANPRNLAPYFLDNYIDFFRLFLREDPADYEKLKAHREMRLALMGQGDPASPYFLYTKAIIHFQWAIIRVLFEEYWSAAWEFRRSYLIMKDNNKKFPAFGPNKMILGAMQTVIGTVPDGYKWVTNILGMTGTISKGMSLLQSFAVDGNGDGSLFREEAWLYYAFMKFYIENKPEEAMHFITTRGMDMKNNRLYALALAYLAVNGQMSAYGMKVLDGLDTDGEYVDMPVVDFEMGVMKLNHLETGEAISHLERFLKDFKGKFYVKDALLRLSWAYYLEGNMAAAQKYRQLILTRGNAQADADKAALREARSGTWPDKELLRARLLSDGGYFQEALKTLSGLRAEDFPAMADKIEYAYRLARVHDELGDGEQAIALYGVTIRLGASRPEYYAARSALQLGYIYEKRGDKSRAIAAFRQCLGMEEIEYKSSLDQKAKAGINRLSGN